MRIVMINGGLGNQVFQYIFGRVLELETGEPVYFDDSYFHFRFLSDYITHSEGNTVDITIYWMQQLFGFTPRSLSACFTPDVWNYMLNAYEKDLRTILENPLLPEAAFQGTNIQQLSAMNIPQQLKNNGLDLAMIAETSDCNFNGNIIWTPTNQYNELLFKAQGNLYFHGYWIHINWFLKHKEQLLKELTFPALSNENNIEYLRQIESTESVAIHIRYFRIGRIPEQSYREALAGIRRLVKKPVFFVFSDLIDEVVSHAKEYGFLPKDTIVFVKGNHEEKDSFADLVLMSRCRHMVISNSSYNFLAYLLNQNQHGVIANLSSREIKKSEAKC